MRTTALFAVLIVAACGAGQEPGIDETPTTTTTTVRPTTTQGETSTVPSTQPAEGLPIVEPARTALAAKLGVESETISVVMAERVTWPDGSLGCPQPGESYTQAVVDGSKVVLQHDDRVYLYHAGPDDEPFLCPSEEKDGGHEFLPPPGYRD